MRMPPGKPLGNPGDVNMQRKIIEAGFELLESEIERMTVMDLPFRLKKLGIL